MDTPGASDLNACPTCKICDRGTLMPRKISRLSGPAVAIGYVLLIPSILGMAACAILLIVSLLAGVAGAAHWSSFVTAFAGIGSLAILYVAVLCFVAGLLGWLLIMRKYVLQCGYCGAVVNAVAPISSQPNWSFGRARIFGFFLMFLSLVALTVVLTHRGNTPAQTTPAATTAEQVKTAPDNSTAEPAQPAPGGSAANPLVLNVTLNLSGIENTDQGPILAVKTNLPSKVTLMATFGGNGYAGQAERIVPANHIVQFGLFSPISTSKTGSLSPGVYTVEVDMVDTAEADSVFGEDWQGLTGPAVITTPGTPIKMVSQTFHFKINPDGSVTNPFPEPAQPAPDNSAAAPAESNTMQPFTSAAGRFSVLFPGTPMFPGTPIQSSQTVHLKNGETTMQYHFASGDNGTSFIVAYEDYPPDVVGPSPQAFLQENENFKVNGKTLLTDAAGYLNGAPGRAFTFTGAYADGSSRSCNVHEFLAGTRLYTLTVLSPPIPLKGDTATQADQFLNSFRILDNPPRP